MLRNESTYKLPLNKNTYRAIKMQTGTTIDIEQYIYDCVNEYKDSETGNGLFNADKNHLWSASFLRRMEKYEDLKEKRKQAANARWNNRSEKKEKKKDVKKCKCIKNKCKCIKKRYTCNAKSENLYAKICKLNEIKSNQIKLNKIKLNKINSIYPSDHQFKENTKLNEMLDEIDKIRFEEMVSNCKIINLKPTLFLEIREILKELYINPETREKIDGISEENIYYALNKFSIANTKTEIKIPKQYFKKCILSAMQQTELSKQYDTNTILKMGSD